MKKMIFTLVFMLISIMAIAQTVTASSNWYTFNTGTGDATRISFVIDSNNKSQIYLAYSTMSEWPNISYNNDVFIEYTDGTVEKTKVNKRDIDYKIIYGMTLYVTGIFFDIYGPNFDKKTISVIHLTNDNGGWIDITPSKKWVKNERKYKDNMLNEAFSRLIAKKRIINK